MTYPRSLQSVSLVLCLASGLIAGLVAPARGQADLQPVTLVPLKPFEFIDDLSPRGSPFAQALFAEYKALAFSLKNQPSNMADALYFARKAVQTANGREIVPAFIDGWLLDRPLVEELKTARRRLNQLLQPNGLSLLPQQTAKLQVLFDCWVEQSELQAAINQVSLCRDRFWRAFEQTQIDLRAQAPFREFGGIITQPSLIEIDVSQPIASQANEALLDLLVRSVNEQRLSVQVIIGQEAFLAESQDLVSSLLDKGLDDWRLTLVTNPDADAPLALQLY